MQRWTLVALVAVSCAAPIERKMKSAYMVDWHGDLEDAVEAASKENPVAVAFDHPGGFMTTCNRSYRVIVHANGAVDFWGRNGTRERGFHRWSIPPDRVQVIVRKFEPWWDRPIREDLDIVDAGPDCLFVSSGERRFLKCVGFRDGMRIFDFTNYILFKTNAVQWLGEPGENRPECTAPE